MTCSGVVGAVPAPVLLAETKAMHLPLPAGPATIVAVENFSQGQGLSDDEN